MKTDDLIAALAADTLPRLTVGQRLLRALPAAFVVSVAGFLMFRGVRPDLGQALASVAALKTVVPLALAVLAGALTLGLARPGAPTAARAAAVAAVLAVLGAAFLAALADDASMGLAASLGKPSLVTCLTTVPALAVPLLAAVLWALSAGAPLHPARAGAAGGLAAGALAAALYSLHCDQDTALFVLPAYGAAVLMVTLAGTLAGARVLRW
ncbi:MAG: DUF1109 domain-containing protein [Rhodobacteraceae bacterium]|jgi:hypothetical protein|nr:DUF1109 domain-containing protein [Paracoccaceae bacterium]